MKFDFTGLATALENHHDHRREFIVQRHPEQADFFFENVPLDDAATFTSLFADGKTEPCSSLKTAACRACCAMVSIRSWRTIVRSTRCTVRAHGCDAVSHKARA